MSFYSYQIEFLVTDNDQNGDYYDEPYETQKCIKQDRRAKNIREFNYSISYNNGRYKQNYTALKVISVEKENEDLTDHLKMLNNSTRK